MADNTSTLSSLSAELSSLVARTASSVVAVAARPHRGSSGLLIGGDLVLTADHTIERDQDIGVLIEGNTHQAVLVGRDPATDLAVLRVTGLQAPELATAAPPAAGSLVVSVSRTTSGTVSSGVGVITSIGGPLRTPRGVVLPAIVRTDAALRPGTGGGALVDTLGRIVGITTSGLLRGLPVAIPAPDALNVARRLAANEPLGRGYLGVNVQLVRLSSRQHEAAAGKRGLLVLGIASDGAADRAGVLVGDVLLRFAGQHVTDADSLQDRLARLTPGSEVAISVLRGTSLQDLTVTVAERPPA